MASPVEVAVALLLSSLIGAALSCVADRIEQAIGTAGEDDG